MFVHRGEKIYYEQLDQNLPKQICPVIGSVAIELKGNRPEVQLTNYIYDISPVLKYSQECNEGF